MPVAVPTVKDSAVLRAVGHSAGPVRDRPRGPFMMRVRPLPLVRVLRRAGQGKNGEVAAHGVSNCAAHWPECASAVLGLHIPNIKP